MPINHYAEKKIMNRLHISVILLAALGMLFTSCEDAGKGKNGESDSLAMDTSLNLHDIDYQPFSHEGAKECADLKPYEFCYSGLNFIKLKDTLQWKNLKVPGGMVKDTVFSEVQFSQGGPDTISWVVRMITGDGPRVFLEADFESGWLLNRVRIENPKYVLQPFGVHVGMTVAELKTKFPNLYVGSLPDYGMVEIYPSSNVFFLVKDTGFLSKDKLPEIGMVPNDAVIASIVLM